MKNLTVLAFFYFLFSVEIVYTAPLKWDSSVGGNDHYYEIKYESLTWANAKLAAELYGGYLATITSQEEQDWIRNTFGGETLAATYLGGYQDKLDINYSEPAGGWKWVTGETWDYTNWGSGEPNDAGNAGLENSLQFWGGNYSAIWNDSDDSYIFNKYLIEWNQLDQTIPEPISLFLFILAFGVTIKKFR